MIIIVESGSTKADWILLDGHGQEIKRWSIMGFNPYFHSSATVEQVLGSHPEISGYAPGVEQVYFYGAGCSSEKLNEVIENGLSKVFRCAQIVVDHDLKAAAYATFDGVPHVACILGTGSNSCYFDGETVREEVPALAYVLGDEGSASFHWKTTGLADYIYGRMPCRIARGLSQRNTKTNEGGDFATSVYHQAPRQRLPRFFLPFCG